MNSATFRDEFPTEQAERKFDVFSGQVDPEALEGSTGLYRVGFQSMVVLQLPAIVPSALLSRFAVGDVEIFQTTGPVRTQFTTMVQRPGLELEWYKRMESRVPVGHNLPLSVLQVRGTFSSDPIQDLRDWRENALHAAGVAACVLDERLFQAKIFEDAVVFDDDGDVLVTLDEQTNIRTFMPRFIVREHGSDFGALQNLDLEQSKAAAMAAKWYLRAVRQGPLSDSVVALWVALEALLARAQGRSMTKKIEVALALGGYPLPDAPPVGRMAGVRAEIVHKGEENPDFLRETHYQLETIFRTLLRAYLMLDGIWPVTVGANILPEPIRSQVDAAWKNPKVTIF